MNKYLKAAAKRFQEKFKKEFLINPISNTDAEVLVEIGEILRKNGLGAVKAILDNYKYKKDSEILDDLTQYNIDNPEKGGAEDIPNEVEGEKQLPNPYLMRQFRDIEDSRIKIISILGYSKALLYCNEFGRKMPCILINECDVNATKKPMYANKTLFYPNENVRDEDFYELDEIL